MCLRGVRELERIWLAQDTSSDVAVFVVWSSQLGAAERHVPDATRLISDPRARHYWDPDRLAGRAVTQRFARMLDRSAEDASPAWDVWLLFDRDARWDSLPPEPAWWEHQLDMLPADRHLDPERFAGKARELRRSGRP